MKKETKNTQRSYEEEEIALLEEQLATLTRTTVLQQFVELPLSKRTMNGLKQSNFCQLTEIQQSALILGLKGHDILGAAKTGSGKTLAFLIPVLECLYRNKWTQIDGLGALIISPTRELALQIFDVLRKIGSHHQFSAGLVIGGKNIKEEKERMGRMNILVCTPGRLLQHMDQTQGFDCSNLRILVLDEADRIMDMGFEKTLNAIVENLPRQRQTLLFSATQTKSVKDLVRLSLKDPEYVAVHEKSEYSTPQRLLQHYVVCELHEKLDIMYSFIKSHLSAKTIIFVASCKEVRFFYEGFRRIRPGIPLMHLHGKQDQMKRMAIFYDFCKKTSAVLIATDIAARGLDFPAIDWVIQLDCPEDGETYIHRVGRTARYESEGRSLLFLLPSEEAGMMEVLLQKKIPIQKIKINPQKTQSIQKQLNSFCTQDPELKYLAQKAFITYMRSVYVQKNKKIFDVTQLPHEKFAASLGLASVPQIKFTTKAKKFKNASHRLEPISQSNEPHDGQTNNTNIEEKNQVSSVDDFELRDNTEIEPNKKMKSMTKIEKMFNKKNQDVLSERYSKLRAKEEASSNFEDILVLKRRDHNLDSLEARDEVPELSHRDKLKMKLKHRLKTGGISDKIVFDDEGNAHKAWELESVDAFYKGDILDKTSTFLSESKQILAEEDIQDKYTEKLRLKEKKLKRKFKEKQDRHLVESESLQTNSNIDKKGHDDTYIPPFKQDQNKASKLDFQYHSDSNHSAEDTPRNFKRKRSLISYQEFSDNKLLNHSATLNQQEELVRQFLAQQ